MNPNYWRAIDRIGSRKASRFEWENASGMAWEELAAFLRPAGGHAVEVPDPDDPAETLVVWEQDHGNCLLESQQIPAHREAIRVETADLALHRADVRKLCGELAARFSFTPRPPTGTGPLFEIGFVQSPKALQRHVHLFVPAPDPVANSIALAEVGRTGPAPILLLPSSRWAALADCAAGSALEIEFLDSFFERHQRKSLVSVAAGMDSLESRRGRAGRSNEALLPILQGDRWEDVWLSFNPTNGFLRVRIGKRAGEVRVWNTSTSSEPSKDALILGHLITSTPPAWSVENFTGSQKRNMQRAFQRFKERLRQWVPIVDGEPFVEDRRLKRHEPAFRCEGVL